MKTTGFRYIVIFVLLALSGCSEPITPGTMEEANALLAAEKHDKAAPVYRYLANEKGNTQAMLNMGHFYYGGQGVDMDRRKAFDWFLKAANAGNPDAYLTLGVMNVNGTYELDEGGDDIVWVNCHAAIVTCERSVVASIWWYVKAVATGQKEAIEYIISAYNSRGAERYAWGQLAINHGIDISSYNEEIQAFKNQADPQNLQQAEAWAEKLIDLYGVNSLAYNGK
ncbi:hypothetical protein MNBD_GAMMA11-2734 [hydrothermal vent metagenome]|uniref:Sel1 repeat family protein n=1 Tax=hydrothermal vent metagenome TaxID=652676 RepID=A0A3B0X2V0_9ZZZZ